MVKYNFSSIRTRVVRNEKINPRHVILHVPNPGGTGSLPGQFAMLRLPDPAGRSFMLSRPFSIMSCEETIEFLIRIVGRGSNLLASLKQGDVVEILFPLGTSFPDPGRFVSPLLIAGGCGVAPLMFLARAEAKRGRPVRLLYGAGTKGDLVLREDLDGLCRLKVSTDDGTEGFRGLVTQLLEKEMKSETFDLIAACGPGPLLERVAEICRVENIECVVSVETVMGCGFGACLGCAVPRSGGGYLYACKDGPVINARDIDWTRF